MRRGDLPDGMAIGHRRHQPGLGQAAGKRYLGRKQQRLRNPRIAQLGFEFGILEQVEKRDPGQCLVERVYDLELSAEAG